MVVAICLAECLRLNVQVLPSTPPSLAADTIVNEVVSTLIKYLDESI